MGLADINTRAEFANLIGINLKDLTYLLYKADKDKLYTTFSIPKKSGGSREINAPQKKLKYAQRLLKNNLEAYIKDNCPQNYINNKVSTAFQKNKSIIINAQAHKNKKYVLNFDLEDFFNSFNFGRVRGFFIKNRYWQLNPDIATIIAQLTCHNGVLPQGAPTSPIITNLICSAMDWRIIKLSRKYKLTYTRYADDITFSTNESKTLNYYNIFYTDLKNEIDKCGFKINETKSRIQDNKTRQEVTGLVVNRMVGVKREYYKNTQAMAHQLYTTGDYTIDGKSGTLSQLEGRFSFIDQLDRAKNKNLFNQPASLPSIHCAFSNRREKKYQEFLFYKYFCANQHPMIITEGKTDSIYLKAALKQMYGKFPNIISKISNEEFRYNLSFMNLSSRLKYFFSLNEGGHTLCNLCYLYKDQTYNKFKKTERNFRKDFLELYKINPSNPVIILLDNEKNNNDSPLSKFISCKLIDKSIINKQSFCRISSNLYVQWIPLKDGKRDCEIEDLLMDDIDGFMIDGKKFDRSGEKSLDSGYYNKMMLADYVTKNNDSFNFELFSPIFNDWKKIVDDYNEQRKSPEKNIWN